ncbi:MAG: hypothetical protein KDE14_00165 [Rhodobacteraceae bacterium]|nr:hypothetical protein [Paracoccaceae bacterium]
MIRSRSLVTAATGLALGLSAPAMAASKTLGFVVPSWETATYETKYYDECPDGLAIGNDELWWKGLSQRDKDVLTNGGEMEPVDPPRRPMAVLRGPKKEDVCWNPEIVVDPPQRIVKGKFGYGMNLDGTTDGAATPKSCKHEKFVTPDGSTYVDNQMYRLVGCIYGWRKGNYVEAHADRERRDSSVGIILIEVTGVDDEQNDPEVEVSFHATRDVLYKDINGAILPYATFRVSETQHYGATAKGRIVDGKIVTDPADIRLPLYGHQMTGDMYIKDLRLDLPVQGPADDGPHLGMIAGYYDFDSWWDYTRRLESLLVTGQWSCPAMYVAAKQLADGYPDPETGECTAISTAMNIQVLPAFVVHPDRETADAGSAAQ